MRGHREQSPGISTSAWSDRQTRRDILAARGIPFPKGGRGSIFYLYTEIVWLECQLGAYVLMYQTVWIPAHNSETRGDEVEDGSVRRSCGARAESARPNVMHVHPQSRGAHKAGCDRSE